MQKKYDLCAIGNALVDIQFEISQEELEGLHLDKGSMCLASSEKQSILLNSMADRQQFKSSGGSAANTIIAFAELGGRACFQTSLGNDDFGRFYAHEFRELGITLKAPFIEEEPTGTCIVFITPDSERTMHTCLAATSKFNHNHLDEDLIKQSEWLYLEGYHFSIENSADASFKASTIARENDTLIAVTFSDSFIIEYYNKELTKVVQNANLIFCNEKEACLFTEENNYLNAFNKLGKECENVALTLGSKGSLIKWGNNIYEIPPVPVQAIDSTGAGDMYAGAFLYGIQYLQSPEKAARLASLAASRIVSQFGARYDDDLKELLNFIN